MIKLDEDAEMTLEELSAKSDIKKIATTVFLKIGRLLSNIARFTNVNSKYNVRTLTMVAGVRGTEFVVELTDSTLTDVGVFEGEVAVGGIDAQGKLVKDTEVILQKGYQTKVRKNRKPKPPFKLEKKMLAHQKKLDTLREKAVEIT